MAHPLVALAAPRDPIKVLEQKELPGDLGTPGGQLHQLKCWLSINCCYRTNDHDEEDDKNMVIIR